MGFWAEIKHALNSTLGTQKFKPLDKIIENVVTETDKKNKIFVAGGNTIYSDTSSVAPNSSLFTTFVPSISGQIAVSAGNVKTNGYAMDFDIYENDIQIYAGTVRVQYNTTLNVQADKTYKFVRRNYFSDYGAFDLYLTLQADVKQIGYFEITT